MLSTAGKLQHVSLCRTQRQIVCRHSLHKMERAPLNPVLICHVRLEKAQGIKKESSPLCYWNDRFYCLERRKRTQGGKQRKPALPALQLIKTKCQREQEKLRW